MGRAEEADKELEDLYAKVPEIDCKGLCTDACGPVEGGPREMVRLRRAGVRLPPRAVAVRQMHLSKGDYECPALTDGRCSAYEVRPAICRVWGASADLVCPYGCRPAPGERLLTSAETLALIDAANAVGTAREPLPAAEYERMLNTREGAATYRHLVHQPTATRPVPPKRKK